MTTTVLPSLLRGAPNRPYPTDPATIEDLLRRRKPNTHEPLWFYRIRGTCSPREEALWRDYPTAENAAILRDLGVAILQRADFFKGVGLVRERPSMERIIRFARELHQRGVMISVYVGGTMMTEYFFKEVPEARDWARRDQDGNPVTYGGYQLNRWFPCLNHPGYRAYVKKVLDVAMDEVQADEIFFDNQILRYEPRSCRCDHCVRHLRDTIRRTYTLAQCEARYGFAEYPDSVPPVFSQANKPWMLDRVQVPNIQDWIDHRVATVKEFYADMAAHVKARRPTTVVGMNIKGVHGHNRAFDHGICHGAMADLLDFSCIDGYKPGFRNGTIVSEFRFFKSSHSTHISVVDVTNTDLTAAECQVFGYKKKIEGHGWIGGIDSSLNFSPTVQFLRGNLRLYHERPPVRDIAVLRYEPATRYNCAKTHEQLMPFEQTLAVEKLPWGIIYDRQRAALDEFRVVALPEIQALSDAWIEALDAFMRAGGGVIASGGAAGYNEWMRSRDPEHALARWLGHRPEGCYECAAVGQGRFVYVPAWDVAQPWDFRDWCAIWPEVKPLKDRALFLRAVADAAGAAPLSFRAQGNDAVLAEGIVPAAGRADGLDLHFINYNAADTKPVMTVRVALPEGRSAASAELIRPDDDGHPRETIIPAVEGREAVFPMFTPRVYGVARVTFRA
jgi:hypothetical protein